MGLYGKELSFNPVKGTRIDDRLWR